MMKVNRFAWILVAVLGLVTWGCSKESEDKDAGEHMEQGHEMPGAKEMPGMKEGEAAAKKAMEGLNAEEIAILEAQKTCPVSGEELGAMGKPVKMQVGDTVVFLCCPSCVKKFNADPQKYLAMTPQGKK